MKTTKRILPLAVVVTVLLSCFACFSFTASAASAPQIVTDGLVAWYDASNNNNGEQDYDTTIWRDLSGNRNHLSVRVNETNYWMDTAYHIDSSSYYFPEAIVDTVNSEEYTIEFVAGELSFVATNWITLMCSDNDEFSLFIRVPNDTDTESNFEYKYNDRNADRPKFDDGAEVVNNVTVTITFDLTDPSEALCVVYVDGVAKAQGVPQYTNIADTLTFGHENPQRAWSGDIYGFRFYDRALTPEEVMQNSDADYIKYRSGNYYAPEVEYDDSDEEIAGSVTGDFKNDLIPLTEELDLIPTDGFFGTSSIIDTQLYNKEEWTGVRMTRTEELEPDGDGNIFPPFFYVNYQKYCRRAGLEVMKAEDVKYVVVKSKAEGIVNEMKLRVCSGANQSFFEADPINSYDFCFEGTGETEYMIYEVENVSGNINYLHLEFEGMETSAVVYIEEIALFADQESAFAYASREIETEAPTTEAPTEDPAEDPTEAPTETPTEEPTESPTTEAPAKKGCGSVIGFSAAVVLAAAAAVFACKKD